MYRYTEFDHDFLKTRNAQFRAQVDRRLSGALTEDEFKPLRLMKWPLICNAHAYMLRVAIPNAQRSSARKCASWPNRSATLGTRPTGQFHHAPETSIQLAPPARTCPTAGCAGHGSGWHAIQTLWQLRAQQ